MKVSYSTVMHSKEIQNQVKNKVLLGKRVPTGVFTLLVLSLRQRVMWARTCVCTCGSAPLSAQVGAVGVGQGGFPSVCPSKTSSPQRWTLPVSSFPPWHVLCPHNRISEAPALEHGPFPIFHFHQCVERNTSNHKSSFI